MSFVENRLADLQIPVFMDNFKQACISYSVPVVEAAITFVQSMESSLLMVLMLILGVQLLRVALIKAPVQKQQASSGHDQRKVSKELKDMKKQLKSMQKLIEQLKQHKQPLNENSNGNQGASELILQCKKSWEQREKIASEIIDWQIKILTQVKKIKNKSRISRTPSHGSSISKPLSTQSKIKATPKASQAPLLIQRQKKPLFQEQPIKRQESKQNFKEQSSMKKEQVAEFPQAVFLSKQQPEKVKSSVDNASFSQKDKKLPQLNKSLVIEKQVKVQQKSTQVSQALTQIQKNSQKAPSIVLQLPKPPKIVGPPKGKPGVPRKNMPLPPVPQNPNKQSQSFEIKKQVSAVLETQKNENQTEILSVNPTESLPETSPEALLPAPLLTQNTQQEVPIVLQLPKPPKMVAPPKPKPGAPRKNIPPPAATKNPSKQLQSSEITQQISVNSTQAFSVSTPSETMTVDPTETLPVNQTQSLPQNSSEALPAPVPMQNNQQEAPIILQLPKPPKMAAPPKPKPYAARKGNPPPPMPKKS